MKKSKGLSERDVLELLKTVLPKHTNDIDLASKIINDIQRALQQKNQHAAFEKFCERVELPNLEARVETMRAAGVTFRNAIVSGPGGKQILVEDNEGNVIEFFEAR